MQVIDISNPSTPIAVASIFNGYVDRNGNAFDALSGASSVITIDHLNNTYALISSFVGNGLQIIDISNPSTPTVVTAIKDGDVDSSGNEFQTLEQTRDATTFAIGNDTYALAASKGDNGLQIIRLTNNRPILSAASTSVNGATVTLDFDEELSSKVAATSAFEINVDGKVNDVTSVQLTSTDSPSVLLTLSDYIKKGQTVTVSYTDPTSSDDTNALQDLIGLDVESFGNKAVTNKSTRGDRSDDEDSGNDGNSGDDGDSGNDEKKTTPSYRGTKRNDKIKGDNKSNKMYGLKGNIGPMESSAMMFLMAAKDATLPSSLPATTQSNSPLPNGKRPVMAKTA